MGLAIEPIRDSGRDEPGELRVGHCQLGVKHVAEEQESAGNAAARSSFKAG